MLKSVEIPSKKLEFRIRSGKRPFTLCDSVILMYLISSNHSYDYSCPLLGTLIFLFTLLASAEKKVLTSVLLQWNHLLSALDGLTQVSIALKTGASCALNTWYLFLGGWGWFLDSTLFLALYFIMACLTMYWNCSLLCMFPSHLSRLISAPVAIFSLSVHCDVHLC